MPHTPSEKSKPGHVRVTREPLGSPRVENRLKLSPAAAEAHAQIIPMTASRLHAKKGPEAASWEQGQESPKARGKREREKRERLTRKLGGSSLGETRGGDKPRGSRRGQRGEVPVPGPCHPHLSHAGWKGLRVAQDGAPSLKAGRMNGGISARGSQMPETPLSLRGV